MAQSFYHRRKWRVLSRLAFPLFSLSLLLAGCGGGSGPGVNPLLEKNEAYSGGDTTVFANSVDSFSRFASNLTFSEQADFQIGNSFFEQDWITAPATTTARDGLGPLFNANACSVCHTKDGRGSPPLDLQQQPISLLFRVSIPGKNANDGPNPDPVYGDQLQNQSILGVDPEVEIHISYEEIVGHHADGEKYILHRPGYHFENYSYGAPHPGLMFSPRLSPQMIGMGLLEAIPEEDLLALADPDDQDGDGISGRPNWVWNQEAQQKSLGRLGWKANQPNVRQQVAGAFAGDIGITSSIFPQEDCSASQHDCLNAENGGSPELQEEILDKVVFYSQTLAVPARRDWEDTLVLEGKTVFFDIGCAKCHQPKFVTDPDYPIQALAGQTIRPYTDLLLHDMGPDLADGRPDFEASGSEWRTPPLWGIGLIEKVNGHARFLHDGRAFNLEEAILWHGGEAQKSKDAFSSLVKSDREALLKFLNSL